MSEGVKKNMDALIQDAFEIRAQVPANDPAWMWPGRHRKKHWNGTKGTQEAIIGLKLACWKKSAFIKN